MVIAVIAALLVSILSLVPFWVAVKRVRLIKETASAGVLGPFLLTIAISFLILLAGIVLCKLIAADYQVVYSLTELIAFTVGVVVMGLLIKQRQK